MDSGTLNQLDWVILAVLAASYGLCNTQES